MIKCLICKEEIPVNHVCMNTVIGDRVYTFHMGCEEKMTGHMIAILEILIEWNGVWRKYDDLLSRLKDHYSLIIDRKIAKEALKALIEIGEVEYGPLVDSDCIPHGSGYTWVHGEGL